MEELQIFNMQLKKKEIPKNVLKVIDKAIPFAILYTFEFEESFAYGITIKENAEQRYFFSDWNEELAFDFTGNTIEQVYQKTIQLFIQNKTGLPAERRLLVGLGRSGRLVGSNSTLLLPISLYGAES